MEFVTFAEAWPELEAGGVLPADDEVTLPPPPPSMLATLELALDQVSACYRIAGSAEALTLAGDESLVAVDRDRLAESLDHLLHKLHLAPVAVLPRTRWRAILDAVGYSLAEHRGWQDLEAEATLVLNTRDVLVCGPADLKTLRKVIEALLIESGSREDALIVIATSGSLLAEVLPGPTPSIRIEVATAPMAASVRELLAPEA
ncbi:MAG: hypothetical protein ACO3EP_09355 [Phycisphaerales bacterium]